MSNRDHEATSWKELGSMGAVGLVSIGLVLVLLPALLIAGVVGFLAWKRAWPTSYLAAHTLWAWLAIPVVGILITWDWTAPVRLYVEALGEAQQGNWGSAVATAWIWAIPLGWTLATVWWVRWTDSHQRGRGVTADRAVRHQWRQAKYKQARARQAAKVDHWPLTRKGEIVLGVQVEKKEEVTPHPLAKMVNGRHLHRHLTVPWLALRQHMVCVADPGAGKTVMMTRLSLGATVEAWRRHVEGSAGRPLTIIMNCKDGSKAWEDGWEWSDQLTQLGVNRDRVGMWPADVRLDLWSLPPEELEAALLSLIGDDGPEHYTALRETTLHLVVSAPISGPPKSSAEFLGRINADWLMAEWHGHAIEMEAINRLYGGRAQEGSDVLLKYYNLFTKLGLSLDAGRNLDDFDALYIAVDGANRPRHAAAQINAVLRLIKSYLTSSDHEPRELLLFIDEYSAISAEMGQGLLSVVEQMRSLGGSVLAIAQSVEGLGEPEERRRLVSSCSGGKLIMRSTNAGELADMSGTVQRTEYSDVIGADGNPTGAKSARIQDAFALNPQDVRQLKPGEIFYAQEGRVTRGVVVPVSDLAAHPVVDQVEITSQVVAMGVPALGDAMSGRALLEARAVAVGEIGATGDDDEPMSPADFGMGW